MQVWWNYWGFVRAGIDFSHLFNLSSLFRNILWCTKHSSRLSKFWVIFEMTRYADTYSFLFFHFTASVFGRPFVKRFALCYRSVVCPVCLSCPVCDVRALWPNGWTNQDETWHAGRPRPWPHCVRWGPSSPSSKGTQPPNFRPISVAAKWLFGSRCHLVWR